MRTLAQQADAAQRATPLYAAMRADLARQNWPDALLRLRHEQTQLVEIAALALEDAGLTECGDRARLQLDVLGLLETALRDRVPETECPDISRLLAQLPVRLRLLAVRLEEKFEEKIKSTD